ncbi:conserved virulence factor C family protein [Bacillus sp. 2205SS5-2]|uniref:conserved virulence factor C family protein n=1 Tax=Bacillus sp. 2205SS5-2 TaxID=3109031 RepID=UPI0030065BD2
MKIKLIEPTPSPNTMKIILDEELPAGTRANYKKENRGDAPLLISNLLLIEGIKGVYHVADFLALERNAKYDWQGLLSQVREVFGEKGNEEGSQTDFNDHFGEVQAEVQFFQNIPMQIKLSDGEQEKRFSLPDRFVIAIQQVQGDNVVTDRKWKDYGVRYGELEQIGEQVMEELEAAYPNEKLEALIHPTEVAESEVTLAQQNIGPEDFKVEDWRIRYRMLDELKSISETDLPLLELALADEKPAIRRLAVVYLGMIESKQILPLIYEGLHDKTVTVRRTAGDCLSDLGFSEAIPEMMQALKDTSKIVRWRAAMYLYEVGDETALDALEAAQDDDEFEVKMQIKMAIERIKGGEEAKGSVWKQMTESRKNER